MEILLSSNNNEVNTLNRMQQSDKNFGNLKSSNFLEKWLALDISSDWWLIKKFEFCIGISVKKFKIKRFYVLHLNTSILYLRKSKYIYLKVYKPLR